MALLFLLILFLCSFLLTMFFTVRIARFSIRVGFLDHPGGRKSHPAPVPLGGGLAIGGAFMSVALLGLLGGFLHHEHRMLDFLPPAVAASLLHLFEEAPRVLLLLCGALVIMILGLIDDRYSLPPRVKLFVQTLVATGFVVGVDRLELFVTGDPIAGVAASVATVAWMVLIMNAFNLLDHFDGLSCGVAAIIALSLLIPAIQSGQFLMASTLAAFCGCSAAFLVYNFPPATIFLGDTGSLLIGYAIAAVTILFTFYERPAPAHTWLAPLAVLAVPLFDVISVVRIRLREGRSIFEADRSHFAHRLSALGLRPRHVLLVVYALTLCSGIGGFLLSSVDGAGALLIMAQIVLMLLIVSVFLAVTDHGTR
ncbi:MAG: hypothetical protein A2Z34_10720 [Planctomycetes bacterium RBG_16_59_8]|nr:MAG: hypothetical protein A2Z34_10720 [Planctomycetes bacterium RBG_16_59_8]